MIGGTMKTTSLITCFGEVNKVYISHDIFELIRDDPGFSFERGLLMQVDASLAGRTQDETRLLYQQAAESLRQVPGVTAVGFGSIMPFGSRPLTFKKMRP